MPVKDSAITVSDQFCGAGGSSQGVRRAASKLAARGIKGLKVALAMNHWKLAIETHETNFPEAAHDCTDISACDPRRYPSTDILITSPECTNHSLAKGKKQVKAQLDLYEKFVLDPAAERSRATMWDVPRFAEYHKYNIIIVENVVDAIKWVMFDSWLHAMHALGYKHKCVFLNSMFCLPTPQSRDRLYVVFWKKGNKAPNLEFTPPAYCPNCEKNINAIQAWKNKARPYGKYGIKNGQYVYRCPHDGTIVQPYYYAAFNIIDWSDRGERIGDRKKPLADNTIKRIEYGREKYGNITLQVMNYTPGYCKPVTDTTGAFTTNDHHGILRQPFIIDNKQSTGIDFRVNGSMEKIPTVHTDPRLGICNMPFITLGEHSKVAPQVRAVTETVQAQTTRQTMGICSMPFTVDGNYDAKASRAKSVSETVDTQTAQNRTGIFQAPVIIENKGTSKAKPISNQLGAITTVPYQGILTNSAVNAFLTSYYGGSDCTKHITEPMGAATGKDRHALYSNDMPRIEDCYYRTLKPREIKLGMAFDDDYIIKGSGKDQVKQCGNAVTPPAMEWLVERCVESLN